MSTLGPTGVWIGVVASSAAALLGCGQVTAPSADAGGEIEVGADVAGACPITSCAAALRALQGACPTVGFTCTSTTEQTQINACFANGIQVDLDFENQLLARATVVNPNGRVCYAVKVQAQLIGTTFVVTGAAGEPIITEYYRPNLDSIFTCPDGTTLTDGPERLCGVLRTLPEDRTCAEGLCVRP